MSAYAGLFPSYQIKKTSSASVLNSDNFTIRRSVFEKRLCFKPKYIHFVYSFVAHVAFSSCLHCEDQFVAFFSHEEYEDMPLSWKKILFRTFHFFGSEESVWSEITNPFLGSLWKTHPYCWFYSLDSKRVLTFPSKLFLDSPQISVSFNVQDAGRVLVPKIVLSFAQQNTPPLQANWQHVTKTPSFGA